MGNQYGRYGAGVNEGMPGRSIGSIAQTGLGREEMKHVQAIDRALQDATKQRNLKERFHTAVQVGDSMQRRTRIPIDVVRQELLDAGVNVPEDKLRSMYR